MGIKAEVYINNQLSSFATKQLNSFVIEDNIGLELDTLNLEINNAGSFITIPETDAVLELQIGWLGQSLYKMGKFTAQFINATNNIINIRAVSKDLKKGKIKRNRVFKNQTLEEVLKTIANDLKVSLKVENSLKTKEVDYYLQDNQTSLEVLAELSEIFYAVANIKDKILVFISKYNIKEIEIDTTNILKIVKQDSYSKYHNGVYYKHWNLKAGLLEITKLGKEPYLILPNNLEGSLINNYINSKYKEVLEKEYIKINLRRGDPNLQAGFKFTLNTKEEYNQFNGSYRIEKVIHLYKDTFTTLVLAVKLT